MSDIEIEEEALATMRERGGSWFVYQNMALDSSNTGHVLFLKCGPDCTLKDPPPHAPDGPYGLGWKYRMVGRVELKEGKVVPL